MQVYGLAESLRLNEPESNTEISLMATHFTISIFNKKSNIIYLLSGLWDKQWEPKSHVLHPWVCKGRIHWKLWRTTRHTHNQPFSLTQMYALFFNSQPHALYFCFPFPSIFPRPLKTPYLPEPRLDPDSSLSLEDRKNPLPLLGSLPSF